MKAIENLFPVFAYPDINTRGVGRILDSYANPRLRLGFAQLSRILLTPLVLISGYANTENVFYCLVRRHPWNESPNVIEPAKLDGDAFVLFQQITLKRLNSTVV